MTAAERLGAWSALDRDAFVAVLGEVFEHAPWVAEAAWHARPFDSEAALHGAMVAAVQAATPAQQLVFLRGHPELAGREAAAGTLTDASTVEQRGAGLATLSAAEATELRRLNAAYAERHGFPFIVAVLDHDKAQLFDALRRRLDVPTAAEHAEALRQIAAITRRRLHALLG